MDENNQINGKLKSELTGRGFLKPEDFDKYLGEARQYQESIVGILYRSGRVAREELLRILGSVSGCELVDLEKTKIDHKILGRVGKEMAKKSQVLPVKCEEGWLRVAIADPTKILVLDDLRALTGLRIRPVLSDPEKLEQAIGKYYGGGVGDLSLSSSESFERILEEVRSQVLERPSGRGLGDLSDLLEVANASPIVRLVNQLLIEGIRRKASDVFVEPMEKTMRVRYRIDGALEEILSAPKAFAGPVVSRIKVMSRLNIAEHRIPQDGRFKARIFGPEVDLRVSILPTCFGEKACLRILDTTGEVQSLEALGFSCSDLEIIKRCISRPHGMILVTGPTGSGKTTTLYSVLKYLESSERNITTVEDPVEYQVSGINQVNVRDQIGLTFPTALRSILRQDPDIILIGEIRDLTTMDIAIKAALTGHLVLSTLHTNDATSAIVRMINMGIEPFLIASSVIMISAQRLVRKLCSFCKEIYEPEKQILESLGAGVEEKAVFYRAKGCERCRSVGFKGRTVITELFEMKPAILDLIVKSGSGDQLRQLARQEGMATLRASGIQKVKEGVTAIEEVLRVTSPEPSLGQSVR